MKTIASSTPPAAILPPGADGAPPGANGAPPRPAESPSRQAYVQESRQRRRKLVIEIAIMLLIAVAAFALENRFDVKDVAIAWLMGLGLPWADEVITTVAVLSLAGAVFSYRRWREMQAEVHERQRVETALRGLQGELEQRVQARTAELYQANAAMQAQAADHQRALASLGEAEEFNHRLVTASPLGLLYLDQETRITYENPAMARMMGIPAGVVSPVIGMKLLDLPPVVNAINASTAQAIRAGEAIAGEVIHYRSIMGVESDLEIYSAPLLAGQGLREGTILMLVDVTRRRQAEAELQQRLAEMEAVGRLSTALRTAQTVEAMLSVVIDQTLSILGGSAGSIWLYDPARDEVRLAAHRGWGTDVPAPFKRGQGIPGYVVATGETYLTRELRADPRMPQARGDRIPAGLGGVCVPIRAANEIIGVLYVNTMLPHEFTAADAGLLATLAEIAGNAIHRTRLHQETERHLRRLTALSEIDRAISSSTGLGLSLNTLLDQLSEQLSVDAADVLVFDSTLQTLEFAAGRGFRLKASEQVHLRLGQGYAGRAALERGTVYIPRLDEPPAGAGQGRALAGEGFVSYYGVALVAKGKISGVLEVFQRSALEPDREWLDFLNTLAREAAIALDNAGLFDNLQRSNTELALAYDSTIEGWSRALDLRDKETEGHTRRVTDVSVRLARSFGLAEAELTQLRWGALLHDIGKMGVPDGILLKPGPLTPEEWVLMRKHPRLAYEMLAPIHYLRLALDIPYCHHEKWDGSGYPRGLAGEQIPLTARIFAVVDVWDALSSDRPYRAAWPQDRVLEYIQSLAGTHFDPRVVSASLESGVLVRRAEA